MPQKRNSYNPPPPVMTWPKAVPVLVIAGVFDALRFMFEQFWFFGPALAGIYCTASVSDKVGLLGGATATGCGMVVGTTGYFGAPVIAMFGFVMAMATGLAGWLVVGFIIIMTNSRIFKENASHTMWFVFSLLISEIPFIGSLPGLTGFSWKMYGAQIKKDKENLKKYKKEQAEQQLQERNQRNVELAQENNMKKEQAEQQEETDNEMREQEQTEQQESENEETNKEEETSVEMAPTPIKAEVEQHTSPMPPPLPMSSRSVPPPLPELAHTTPPLLPVVANEVQPTPLPNQEKQWPPDSNVPPPIPAEYRAHPSLTTKVRTAQPPPLPHQPIRYTNTSEMEERGVINQDERSVEQVMLRNNAFIVHKIEERGALRHNANSNVSSDTTYSDDIDIMLALEPSISASSVTPGERSNLWPGASGILLGGGQIGEAGATDIGTRSHGIKERGGEAGSIEEIDKIVGRQDKFSRQGYESFGEHGMNELVVNNSKVFGFFQHAERDENGRFWIHSIKNTRYLSEEMPDFYGSGPNNSTNRENLKNAVASYKEHFAIARERGIPLYIMTPDRQVYECLGLNDDGTVETGKQITPEEVAKGRAGLSANKRIEIGERLLKKRVFKYEETQKEAEEIIKSLS